MLTAHNGRLIQDGDFSLATLKLYPAICRLMAEWPTGQASSLPSGYTYLGQFLAHELIPRLGVNERSRTLELDSVYGKGWGSGGHIDPASGKLTATRQNQVDIDLPRQRGCVPAKALIPEFRNDCQLLVSQLHLMLIRFHNRLMDEVNFCSDDPSDRFELVKKGVVATLNRIVIEDYLPRLAQESVYQAIFVDHQHFIDIPSNETLLPMEMTHGALRFGHSQVRSRYRINQKNSRVTLSTLFGQSADKSPQFTGIDPSMIVDWKFLFDGLGAEAKAAMRIDPSMVATMSNDQGNSQDLIARNLLAAIRMQLCSGQVLARRLNAEGLGVKESISFMPERSSVAELTKTNGLDGEIPIWLFVLLEASEHPPSLGNRLGPMGSILLCEAYRSALVTTDVSALKDTQVSVSKLISDINDMPSLLRFIGPSPLTKKS